MTALTNAEFASRVLELASPGEEFKPTAYFDQDGDCIEFLASSDNFYAERVDDLVSVYYSEETGEVVGSLIKGISRLRRMLDKLPGFKVVIRHGKVKLDHVFLARLLASDEVPNELITVTYEKLIAVARQSNIEVELKNAA